MGCPCPPQDSSLRPLHRRLARLPRLPGRVPLSETPLPTGDPLQRRQRQFRAHKRHLGIEFDAVFTAEDAGSYKPPSAIFLLFDRLGPSVPKSTSSTPPKASSTTTPPPTNEPRLRLDRPRPRAARHPPKLQFSLSHPRRPSRSPPHGTERQLSAQQGRSIERAASRKPTFGRRSFAEIVQQAAGPDQASGMISIP